MPGSLSLPIYFISLSLSLFLSQALFMDSLSLTQEQQVFLSKQICSYLYGVSNFESTLSSTIIQSLKGNLFHVAFIDNLQPRINSFIDTNFQSNEGCEYNFCNSQIYDLVKNNACTSLSIALVSFILNKLLCSNGVLLCVQEVRPILYSKLLYEKGHYFLDTLYVTNVLKFNFFTFCLALVFSPALSTLLLQIRVAPDIRCIRL